MNEQSANHVMPALEGQIAVTSITAGSAAAAIAIATITSSRYVTISIDDGAGTAVGAYITTARGAAPAAPNPTATSGDGRTQFYSAADMRALVFTPGDQIRVYAIGSGTHYVRQSPSGPA